MDAQKIFDQVVTHARTQKVKAVVVNGLYCRYRTDDGKKCFFGCLIPDELYNPIIEGRSIHVSSEFTDNEKIKETFEAIYKHLEVEETIENIRFIRTLQIIHDSEDPKKWEDEFKTFAKSYSLTLLPETP